MSIPARHRKFSAYCLRCKLLHKLPACLGYPDCAAAVPDRPAVASTYCLQYCDRGSLQRAIDKNIFRASARWNARVALRAMLRTAREIAQGMCHLHASQIVHGDLVRDDCMVAWARAY